MRRGGERQARGEADEADDLVNSEIEAAETARRQAEFRARKEAAWAAKEADDLVSAELEAAERQEANERGALRTEEEEDEMAQLMEAVLERRAEREPFLGKYDMEPSTSECTGASGVVVFGASNFRDRPVALKFFARRAEYDRELDACKRAMGPHTIALVDMAGPNEGRHTRGRIARCARRLARLGGAAPPVVAPPRTRSVLGGEARMLPCGGGIVGFSPKALKP